MRFAIYHQTIPVLLCLFFIISCNENSTGGQETDSPVGLWELNSTEGDINYVEITDEIVTTFDYQGDEADMGDDCYLISNDEILQISGNIYRFPDPFDTSKTIDVEILATGNTLTVNQPFGDITITLRYTRFNGDSGSFTPECPGEVVTGSVNRMIF
ncbi:MAG: hypothetical protein R3281_06245 [Balneolaceae bacterium]|nr:hypothetical protein [Balneolaceae bacterium]